MKLAFESLKIPPQDEAIVLEDPSVLHLIHPARGGDQMTSIMLGALAGWTLTLNFLSIIKSLTDELEGLVV